MKKQFKQTFFIPDLITIEFYGQDDQPLKQSNILIGIKTFATFRNNIEINPFVSDAEGKIIITKSDIDSRIENFISFGIMDYSSIKFAKSNIEIYFWGRKSISRYLGYEVDPAFIDNLKTYVPNFNEEEFIKQQIERQKLQADYLLYKNSFNYLTKVDNDLVLAESLWDKPQKEIFYKLRLPI